MVKLLVVVLPSESGLMVMLSVGISVRGDPVSSDRNQVIVGAGTDWARHRNETVNPTRTRDVF